MASTWQDIANFWYRRSTHLSTAICHLTEHHQLLRNHACGHEPVARGVKRPLEPCAKDTEEEGGENDGPGPSKPKTIVQPSKQATENAIRTIAEIKSFADIAMLDPETLDVTVHHMRQLKALVPVSKRIGELVGMVVVKQQLFKMIMSQLLNGVLQEGGHKTTHEMMNISILGDSGIGKSTLAIIVSEMMAAAGLLTKGHVITATRTDFVGKFQGHTAAKTLELLNRALGGVLFIDEAYAMGAADKSDSFGLEAVNTLNQFMSENSKDLIVIIAGYKKEIQHFFFASNPGLKRRFPITLELTAYSGEDLAIIFLGMLKAAGWKTTDSKKIAKLVAGNIDHFVHHAGDMESLVLFTKFEASERVWKSVGQDPTQVTLSDVKHGLEKFKSKSETTNYIPSMFI